MSKDVKFKYEKGLQGRDSVTGFVGRITGRADYLTGCRQYLLEGLAQGAPTANWIDEDRLEVFDETKAVEVKPRNVGGPMPHPPGARA